MTRPAQALPRGGYRTIGEQATTKWLGNWGLPRLFLCPIQYAAEANRTVQAIVVTTPWFNNDASDRKNHHASRLYVWKLCHPGRDEQDSLRKRVVGGDGSLTESHRCPSRFWLPEQMQQQMSH